VTGEPYREWACVLPGAVVWSRGAAGGSAGAVTRVLPDGCIDLIHGPTGLLVAGPDRSAHLVPGTVDGAWVGLRLPPGLAPAVLGVPASELVDRRVPLAALWGDATAAELSERLAGATTARAGDVLGVLARRRLADAADGGPGRIRPDPALLRLVGALRHGVAVGRAADALGVGTRQLHRRSLVAFGYGPKTLARILRLTTALDLVRGGRPPAEAAAVAGYADQPHLSREVRALAGVPLRQLVGGPAGSSGA